MKRLLLTLAIATSVAAEVRVAPSRIGLTDLSEVTVGVLARDDGFGAITLRRSPFLTDPSTIRYTPADVTGQLLPAASIDLVTMRSLQSAHVAAAGRGALLAWIADETLYLAPLTSDLHVGAPVKLGPALGSQLACNDSRCLTAWTDAPTGQMKGLITDLSGNELLRINLRNDLFFNILSDPTGFLLSGYDSVTHIDQVSGAATFVTRFPPETYGIIGGDFDGLNYVVVLLGSDPRPGFHNTVAKLDLQGRFTPPARFDAPVSDRALLVWNGQEHLVVLNGVIDTHGFPFPPPETLVPLPPPSNAYVSRLSPSLNVLLPAVQVTSGLEPKVLVNLASNGAGYELAYDDGAASYFANGLTHFPVNKARLERIGPAGDVVSDQAVSVGPLSQKTPALATSGSLRLAVWLERGADETTTLLRASRLTSDGRRLDDTPILLASAPEITLSRKAVAAAGDDFLVVFSESQHPAAIFVHGNGTHERIALPYDSPGSAPEVVTNGRSWMIASSQSFGVGMVRLARSGALLTPTVNDVGPATIFDMATDGDRFALVTSLASGPPCNCVLTEFQLFDADFSRDDKDLDFGNIGMGAFITANADGYVVATRTDATIIRRFDRSGNLISQPAKSPIRGTLLDIQPFSGGWLASVMNAGEADLVHLDRDATTIIATLVEPRPVQAIAANGDGSVSALLADLVEDDFHGIGIAQVLREIAPGHPRRHASH